MSDGATLIELDQVANLVVVGANVVDPDRGDLGRRTVVITGGRIAAVLAPGQEVPAGHQTLIAQGAWVLPALADAHSHLTADGDVPDMSRSRIAAAARAQRQLTSGTHIIRDVGSRAGSAVRRAIDHRILPGPAVVSAGSPITSTAGPGDELLRATLDPSASAYGQTVVDGETKLRAVVRRELRHGAAMLSVALTVFCDRLDALNRPRPIGLSPSELSAIADEAARAKVPIAAFVHGDDAVRIASAAGVTTLEYGSAIDRGTWDFVAARGTILVPCLSSIEAAASRSGASAAGLADRPQSWHLEDQLGVVSMARAAGVRIAAGSGGDHGHETGLAREIELLIDAGLTGQEALRAATTTALDACHLDHARSAPLDDGQPANLIILSANPIRDSSAYGRSVTHVLQFVKPAPHRLGIS
jgi:imidazolonepropionase-like amidohydrolase